MERVVIVSVSLGPCCTHTHLCFNPAYPWMAASGISQPSNAGQDGVQIPLSLHSQAFLCHTVAIPFYYGNAILEPVWQMNFNIQIQNDKYRFTAFTETIQIML
jgi:hypothetical protein